MLFDLRSRLGIRGRDIGGAAAPWFEIYLLVQELAADPTSRVAMALGSLEHAVSPEFRVLADLYDLTVAINSDKKSRGRAKPYPRPGPQPGRTRGSKDPRVDAAFRAHLKAVGHTLGLEPAV